MTDRMDLLREQALAAAEGHLHIEICAPLHLDVIKADAEGIATDDVIATLTEALKCLALAEHPTVFRGIPFIADIGGRLADGTGDVHIMRLKVSIAEKEMPITH